MKANTLIFLLLLFNLNFLGQNDSLEKIISSNAADTIKLSALTDLCWNYAASDLKKSRMYANQELELAQKSNNQKYIATAYNDIGITLIKESKFKEALPYHQKALEIRLSLRNNMDIASSYSKIGYCYSEMSDMVNSLAASLKALDCYVKLKNKRYEAYTLNNICNVYENLQNNDKLIEYANRSYKMALDLNDKFSIATSLNYIASANNRKKNYSVAIETGKKAVTIFRETLDSNSLCATLNNLGSYYKHANNTTEALAYYTEAVTIAERKNDINSAALDYYNIGSLYLSKASYVLAEQYFKKGEALANKQGLQDIRKLIYTALGEVCLKTNRTVEAENYYNHAILLQDSIFSKETAKQISDMQVKYESKQKEEENLLLQKENELKTTQISKGRLMQLFLVGSILLLVVVFYLLYNRNKLKQKQAMDAELLQQQELRSRAIIEAEEKERTRIARELHDGIGQQLSAAKLNISGLQASLNTNNNEEKVMIQNAIDLIDESVKEVRVVSHSMMPNALIKSGLVSAVREFINKISSSGSLRINLEIVGLTDRLEQTVETVLFRVLQELVNNIIKHAQATEVSIQLIRHETELTILIEDNGVGFNVDKVLDKEGGIGLKNIQSRVAFLNGQVFFDSHVDKGTTVTIEIPF
jgi:signal transduction histidine kinase